MSHLDTYIAAKAALTARFTPAQLHGHQDAARTRLTEAQDAMDAACDAWSAHPYDPERLLAVQMHSDTLDSAIAVASEWGIATEPLSIRAGEH